MQRFLIGTLRLLVLFVRCGAVSDVGLCCSLANASTCCPAETRCVLCDARWRCGPITAVECDETEEEGSSFLVVASLAAMTFVSCLVMCRCVVEQAAALTSHPPVVEGFLVNEGSSDLEQPLGEVEASPMDCASISDSARVLLQGTVVSDSCDPPTYSQTCGTLLREGSSHDRA